MVRKENNTQRDIHLLLGFWNNWTIPFANRIFLSRIDSSNFCIALVLFVGSLLSCQVLVSSLSSHPIKNYSWSALFDTIAIAKEIYTHSPILGRAIFKSTSIYDLVLIYVCHFHHHFLLIVIQIWPLSRYSCFYLGSLHPRNFMIKKLLEMNETFEMIRKFNF